MPPMQEFSTVSSSSYDPSALAAKLTEKSADGWAVVSIVPTGGDITAFLSRGVHADSGAGHDAGHSEPVAAVAAAIDHADHADHADVAIEPEADVEPEAPAVHVEPEPVSAAEPEPAVVAEPAGWAVAPEPANTAPVAPVLDPTPSYQPTPSYEPAPSAEPAPSYQPIPSYEPAPVVQPAQVAPAVPAGWYADPAARFELRYWDGNAWTEHVSRAGQQFTDPPVA
jgi:hypothetical protein